MPERLGSMICPQCGKLIGVNEERCPFCGAWRPGMWGITPILQRALGRGLSVTGLIIQTCVALYVISLLLDIGAVLHPSGVFSLLGPSTRALYQIGMTGGAAWSSGFYWTLLTAIFLHGGLLHIFFNLLWVRQLMPQVEEFYGSARAFIIFMVSGVAGFLLSNLLVNTPTIGASGSVFGLIAAAIVYGRRHGGTWGQVMVRQLWQTAILVFVMGFVLSGVNNWAHLGGFVGGYAIAELLARARPREGRAAVLVAGGLALATLGGFIASFVIITRAMLGM